MRRTPSFTLIRRATIAERQYRNRQGLDFDPPVVQFCALTQGKIFLRNFTEEIAVYAVTDSGEVYRLGDDADLSDVVAASVSMPRRVSRRSL